MPIVRIQMVKGRTAEEKKRLMAAVTDAIHRTIDVPLPTIHIMVQEISAENIMIAGELLTHEDGGSEE